MNDLYPPSKAILSKLPGLVVRVEAHDGNDSEGADLLWLEFTPEDVLSEGEVLRIAPATEDRVLWFAALDSAYRFGGWPTAWYMTGSEAEVIAGVQSAIAAAD